MSKGNIYFVKVVFAYQSGRSKQVKKGYVKSSFVGHSIGDVLQRIKDDPTKLKHVLKKVFGKVRDLMPESVELIHESGQTMYDIDK